MSNYFLEETEWEIREHILKYNATFSMTDMERAQFLNLPQGCRIRENAKIISQKNLSIGKNCWIGEGAILDASGGLKIGENTSIGLYVMIWTHDSYRLNIKGKNTRENNSSIVRKKTQIGNNCFIAGHSVIMPGVTIGNKCIIAPMSVVYEDLPDNTVYTPYKTMHQSLKKIDEFEKKILKLEKIIHSLTKDIK